MELKHLTSFVAVADRLSFVHAAKQLHISQPALTGQIQKLEEGLGVQLLVRDRRTVKLTEVGKIFLVEARATLTRARQAVECVQRAARGEVRRLKIGFVSSVALEIVPSIVSEFRKQHPEVTLDLTNLRTVSQVKGLLGENIDIGFLRLPLAHDQLNIKVIHREKFAVILPKGHRLSKEKRLCLAQLQDEPFIAYGRRWAPGFFDSIIQMCTREGFRPNIVQETGEMYTAIALVKAGVGIAILPQSVVLAQSKNIVMKLLPKSSGCSEIALATRAGEDSSLVLSFIALAGKMCKTIS
ncbi:LysR substrate-binding domain-containing protein [Granulicella mallensis]|uniref:Transcriptional regulator, LysR family n=1 Tax=Granulicella mallensis (strain ATCC BAA-1857 / DSM 23137 / MP5ACTX8) TaxID=682795 RepID=G8NZ49_GRAMM|nr:LysR substrate-binding domain-containing protein [Granulicella mallensis]AEU36785.1 transcriptional regulator, LysR family [Granulicella mallensis MP5ACTX8]